MFFRTRLPPAVGLATLAEMIAAGVFIYGAILAVEAVLSAVRSLIDDTERRYIAALGLRRALRPLGLEWPLYFRRHRRLVRMTRPYAREVDRRKLLAKLQGKKLVFAVTAGRSGTTLARQLFALLPDLTSEHEPEPGFHVYLRQIERNPDVAGQFLVHLKLPYLAELQTSSYIELSHAFCKGFLEPLLDLGVRPNLLILRREPRLIALSYLKRFTVPERTFLGLEWLISPRFARSMPLPGWRRMSDYQLLFWYALEIERRQLDYTQRVRSLGGVVREICVAALKDFDFFIELSEALGILAPSADRAILALRHAEQSRIHWNRNEGPLWKCPGEIDREEEEVWHAVSQTQPDLRCLVEAQYSAQRVSSLQEEVL